MHDKVTKKMHLTFYLIQIWNVSAFESAPDGLSEETLRFEVEIKGAIKVAIELHLKMLMVVHLLVQKCSQNSFIKGEHEEAFYFALEGTPKFHFKKHKKMKKNVKK